MELLLNWLRVNVVVNSLAYNKLSENNKTKSKVLAQGNSNLTRYNKLWSVYNKHSACVITFNEHNDLQIPVDINLKLLNRHFQNAL